MEFKYCVECSNDKAWYRVCNYYKKKKIEFSQSKKISAIFVKELPHLTNFDGVTCYEIKEIE
jgi:hypothetical protein